MYRTYVYLPEELRVEIEAVAQSQRKSKAAVIRKALEFGLKKSKAKKPNSALALVKMAKFAEKHLKDEKVPKDLARRHNEYTWD